MDFTGETFANQIILFWLLGESQCLCQVEVCVVVNCIYFYYYYYYYQTIL